jgi:hypothetical protein
MIYSSADILMILGGDAIIRQEARLSIVDGKPGLDYGEYVYIYVDRYPTVEDFQATWKIWIINGGSDLFDLVLNAATRLLPSFDFNGSYYTTTDFASEKTVVKTQAEKELEATRAEREQLKQSFAGLSEGLKEQLSSIRDGVDGKDGKDGLQGPAGRDGRDGRDGKDIDATEVELFDLKDVEQSILQLEKGQVLTWNGIRWTNLYIPKVQTISGGGSTVVTASGANVIISDTKPLTREDGSALQAGDEWWNSMTGISFIWYVDDDSSQWVQSAGSGSGGVNSLNDLQDVDIDPALLARDQGLLYDGTSWTVGSPPVLIEATNTTGLPILKATPVCVTGTAPSGKPQIGPASSTDPTDKPAIGLADRDIGAGEEGYVLVSGKLFQTDTSGYADGDALYLSSTAGALTATRPLSATERVQKVGLVTRVHPTVGTILVIGAGRANDVNNEIVALTGVDLNATNLGTFTGTTISDNETIKGALQELENSVENRPAEAPQDGNYYVRQNGAWVELQTALTALGYNFP